MSLYIKKNGILFSLLCLAILLFPIEIFAQDFSPIIQIINVKKDNNRQYSGVVYNEDPANYYVLTCAHGILDLEEQYVNLHSNLLNSDINSPLVFVSIKSKIIKSDIDRDVAVLYFSKIGNIKIVPLKVSQDDLALASKAYGYGYVGEPIIITNPIIVNNYDKFKSEKGNRILECIGRPISGMSGGPLIFEDKVYGIQSAGNISVLYCPSKEIHTFLSE